MTGFIDLDMDQVCKDLRKLMLDCNKRCLLSTATWAAELYRATKRSKLNLKIPIRYAGTENEEFSVLFLAKTYFAKEEYDRVAYLTKNCISDEGRFLHYYAMYCSSEKKRISNIVDISSPIDKMKNIDLTNLEIDLCNDTYRYTSDGYCLYLRGVALKKLHLNETALSVLCRAIRREPLHWGSWLELSSLIGDEEMLNTLNLPDHWMKHFFLAHTYLELQMYELALEIYIALSSYFNKSSYIMAQIAISFHHLHDLDRAISGFASVLGIDPYRLDNLDIYSNLLYVREMRIELGYLAQNTCSINKYRIETCCVIGNFYSLRSQHDKAVLYFQRALKLNPNYLSAWTLMGHEYMEMKNTSFAIQAYRQAIEVNRRDYRAWYGLGQTYEMIKMPFYCLYYYKQAQQLRPNDSRMMVALGETYEKLEKLEEAKKCYWRAHAVGDMEGMALIKLAKVYEKLNDDKLAAAAFIGYTQEAKVKGLNDRDELCHSYLFLAKYYLKYGNLESAYENAQQCLEYPETKEGGKNILRQIATLRSTLDDKSSSFHFEGGDSSAGFPSLMEFSFTP